MTGHELLLRLAGRIPDQALAQARRMLADGAVSSAVTLVATQLAQALLTQTPIPLTADELAAIRNLARDAGALPGVQPVADLPALPFDFGELDDDGAMRRDELDEALVAAAEAHSAGLAGVWRSWRYVRLDSPDSAWPGQRADAGAGLMVTYDEDLVRPHRVYIVQVEDPGLVRGLAADLLGAVPDTAGAGIEIITLGTEPPPYQRAALAQSLLLWATVTEAEFVIARVFDFADPVTGPGFAPGHPMVDDPVERDQLLAYLRGGYPVLTTTTGMTDVLDQEAGAVVPTSFRTDGEWIWTDTVEYYLNRHGLAPDAELTAHIELELGRGHLVPGTDEQTAMRAADFLLHPPATQTRTAVWFPGNDAADRS
jgi:hypothetical protein